MNEYKLGKVAGLHLSVEPLAIVGSLLLFVLLSIVAIRILNLSGGEAIAASLLAVLLHWASDILHHLAHAWAARRTGYPMIGIRLGKWGLLGTSLYPPDEQPLPPTIHIHRAIGGPVGSLLVSIVVAVTTHFLLPWGTALWWVGVFTFLDNLTVFTLGALLPLGFTDGSTLLQWWGKH